MRPEVTLAFQYLLGEWWRAVAFGNHKYMCKTPINAQIGSSLIDKY